MITAHSKVVDCWETAHPESEAFDRDQLDDKCLVEKLGATCDSRLNTWRAHVSARDMDDFAAKRLDYVFTNPKQAKVIGSSVVFTELVNGMSMSDHFGVRVELELKPGDYKPKYKLMDEDIAHLLDTITEYTAREKNYMFWRLVHLVVSLLVIIGCLIAVFWVKHLWAAFILILVSTLVGITGAIHGLVIGFLFGRWELRGLKQFQTEMELLRKIVN